MKYSFNFKRVKCGLQRPTIIYFDKIYTIWGLIVKGLTSFWVDDDLNLKKINIWSKPDHVLLFIGSDVFINSLL